MESAKTYTGMTRRYSSGCGKPRTPEELAALRKAANANLASLPQRLARADFEREMAGRTKRHQRELDKAYRATLRADIKELKAERTALRRLCRDCERHGEDCPGQWEEADARLDTITTQLAKLQRELQGVGR